MTIGAVTGAAIGAVSGGIQGYKQNGWSGVLSGMGSGALNGMADGFMGGAITGAITGAASGIKSLGSTSKLMNGKSTNIKPSDCFVAGTKILTEHGKKNIEDVKVGDKVWSWNENTKKQELKPVVQLFRNNKRDMVYITVGGEKITTTTEHPFYVKGKGWVRAKNLLDTDILVCYNDNEQKIGSVQIEYAENAVQTYNFEVEGNHNYYVGDRSVLAHNVCNKEATKIAKELGYKKTKFTSHGKAVFENSKAQSSMRYITADADGHIGGVWKAASSVSNLGSKTTRTGTFDITLKILLGD